MHDGATTILPGARTCRAHTDKYYWGFPYSVALRGLVYAQVENWFINIRMREWRPAMRRALDHAEVATDHGAGRKALSSTVASP